jgi:hypothetical protein
LLDTRSRAREAGFHASTKRIFYFGLIVVTANWAMAASALKKPFEYIFARSDLGKEAAQ